MLKFEKFSWKNLERFAIAVAISLLFVLIVYFCKVENAYDGTWFHQQFPFIVLGVDAIMIILYFLNKILGVMEDNELKRK